MVLCWLMSQTELKCSICEAKLVFNINDASTFINKTEKGTFYGSKIAVYRIFHLVDNKKHINAVIVDKGGFYRGFVDSYLEDVSPEETANYYTLIIKDPLANAKFPSESYDLMLFIDSESKQIVEQITGESNVKIINFAEIIVQRTIEGEKIYHETPSYYKTWIADKKLYIWKKGKTIIALSVKKSIKDKISVLEKFLTLILTHLNENNIESISRRNCYLVMRIIEISDILKDSDIEYLIRIITDDSLNFLFNVNTNLEDLVNYTSEKYEISADYLEMLFLGQVTILDIIFDDDTNLLLYKMYVDLMDFLDQRKLIFGLDDIPDDNDVSQ